MRKTTNGKGKQKTDGVKLYVNFKMFQLFDSMGSEDIDERLVGASIGLEKTTQKKNNNRANIFRIESSTAISTSRTRTALTLSLTPMRRPAVLASRAARDAHTRRSVC